MNRNPVFRKEVIRMAYLNSGSGGRGKPHLPQKEPATVSENPKK